MTSKIKAGKICEFCGHPMSRHYSDGNSGDCEINCMDCDCESVATFNKK